MRIAFVSQEYPPETAKGGLGTQTFLKAHGFAAMGHDVHVVSHAPDGRPREYRDGDVQVTRIPGFYGRMNIQTDVAGWLTYAAEVAAAVDHLHARTPLDIVDFPEWGGEGFVHLLNRTERNYIPTVLHLHGPLVMFANEMGWPEIESELFRFGTQMERACFRLADAVYSSSRCSADWCLEHYHARTDDIPVIHTGVDTTRFAPAGPKADRPTVIFVGRLSRNKGVETLVDAVCRLAPEVPRLRLLMLGEGDPALVAQLEHAAAHRPGLLEIRATTGPDDLAEQLCRAHVFAAPSVYEGGPGFVYLEAMACGLPAVGCSGSGVAEVISSGDTGVLVPPQDVDALSDALQTLLHDERRREEMGARARRWVLEHAERAQCLARLESFVGQWCRS